MTQREVTEGVSLLSHNAGNEGYKNTQYSTIQLVNTRTMLVLFLLFLSLVCCYSWIVRVCVFLIHSTQCYVLGWICTMPGNMKMYSFYFARTHSCACFVAGTGGAAAVADVVCRNIFRFFINSSCHVALWAFRLPTR